MPKKDKVALIGMPGAGKSTVGKRLAEKLGYAFYDMDDMIVRLSGASVDELFARGEDVFRSWESTACRELVKKSRAVIATGGGVVTVLGNTEVLREHCVVLYLSRPLEQIEKDADRQSRPLLRGGEDRLRILFAERRALYRKAAHLTVDNAATADEAADRAKLLLFSRIEP